MLLGPNIMLSIALLTRRLRAIWPNLIQDSVDNVVPFRTVRDFIHHSMYAMPCESDIRHYSFIIHRSTAGSIDGPVSLVKSPIQVILLHG